MICCNFYIGSYLYTESYVIIIKAYSCFFLKYCFLLFIRLTDRHISWSPFHQSHATFKFEQDWKLEGKYEKFLFVKFQ